MELAMRSYRHSIGLPIGPEITGEPVATSIGP